MTMNHSFTLREATPAQGYGFFYAVRTARAWWFSAWLRTLARFSRTYLGSFWLGLSNLLSVALLGIVYGAVFNVADPLDYVIYLGFGITIWGFLSQAVNAGCGLFTGRRDQLINNSLPAIFYCLEEWAFQLQTFFQALLVILLAGTLLRPILLLNAFLAMWLPLANVCLFSFWMIILMALMGSRYKDLSQLVPIVLQLLFLISPILYKREGLGRVGLLADLNPFYRVLAPLRNAFLEGIWDPLAQLLMLLINIILICLGILLLKKLRYRIPLWI